MYFSLEIESNNDSLKSPEDVIGVLQNLIEDLYKAANTANKTNIGSAKDSNGDIVGVWLLKK